jgi:hypothetical protein
MKSMKRVPEGRDQAAEKIAWLTEGLIRIGPYRIGLDPIIGLVPGVGDFLTAIASVIIVLRAIALGIPKAAVARMVVNVAVDAAVGAIPFLGDLFDFAFKANTKNLAILRESLQGRRRTGRDRLFVIGVSAALVIAVALPLIVLFYVAYAMLPSKLW